MQTLPAGCARYSMLVKRKPRNICLNYILNNFHFKFVGTERLTDLRKDLAEISLDAESLQL
jgi:hypothetical protein